jgi:hypothetical protein
LSVGGLGTGGASSNDTTKLVTEQTGGNRRTGASGLPSTEKVLKIPVFFRTDNSLYAISSDNSVTIALANRET